MECFSQAIEDACGCNIYYMPRFNRNAKVCSRADSNCYNSVRISLERGENKRYSCECFPACDELNFSGTISSTPLMTTHFHVQSPVANFSNEALK